jgi:hypothetical protein
MERMPVMGIKELIFLVLGLKPNTEQWNKILENENNTL